MSIFYGLVQIDAIRFYKQKAETTTGVEKEKYTFGIMYDCSLCENRILDNGHPWNYCPNCGAKMNGGED